MIPLVKSTGLKVEVADCLLDEGLYRKREGRVGSVNDERNNACIRRREQ